MHPLTLKSPPAVTRSTVPTPKCHGHQTDANCVIRDVLLATNGPKSLPRKIRVVFRYPDGKVGNRDYSTHWLHSYPAKMFHRIPQKILSALDNNGNAVVLDPFCGSGTVLIEAALRGNDAIGVDINPLARLLTTVKSTPLPSGELHRLGELVLTRARNYSEYALKDEFLDFWFKREAQMPLFQLRRAIEEIHTQTYKNFFLITFSSIIRRCSLADPAIPPPVRLSEARIPKANGRYRRHFALAQALSSQTVYEHFHTALLNNIRRLGQLDLCRNMGRVHVLGSPSEGSCYCFRPAFRGHSSYVATILWCPKVRPHAQARVILARLQEIRNRRHRPQNLGYRTNNQSACSQTTADRKRPSR